jgi:hypothetical protein
MATTSTKTPETTKAEATPLQQIIEASYRHIDGFISHRWGEYGTVGQGLRLTPQARMRLGHVFGWLTGLAATGNAEFTKFAEKAATNLFEKLDWLAHYGGYINEENRVPKYLVELHDDGTLHGFSLLWLIAVAPEQQSGVDPTKFRSEYDRYFAPKYRYVYSFNGGLLYHGPGAGETFCVNLGDSLWGIHT